VRTPQSVNLPIATPEYSSWDEQASRRTTEQYIESLRSDIEDNELKKSSPGSLALRRYQFLLMGA
jgi:hypothetical protein